MRAILAPVGSAGDVHPFLGLGAALAERGHDVVVACNAHFAPLARQLGLGFREVGDERSYDALLADPRLWSSFRGVRLVLRASAEKLTGLLFEAIRDCHEPGRTVLVGHSIAFGARVARDALGAPLATIHLQPAILRSLHEIPVTSGAVDFSRWPRWFKRFFWWTADRFTFDPLAGRPINALRRRLGLPRVRRFAATWMNSPDLVLALFPAWYGKPQPDWPRPLAQVGFPLFEPSRDPFPAKLEQFLGAGEPPVVFTIGTAMRHGADFFAGAVEACGRLARRGVLLTRFDEHIPRPLPPEVAAFPYAPFHEVLPRAAAIVHHGGIGTTAQALAAGAPQVIVPMAHDQFDNAARVVRLGCGAAVWNRRWTGERLAAALQEVSFSPAVRASCARAAQRVREDTAPLVRAAEAIEQLLTRV